MTEHEGGGKTCFVSRDPSLSRGRFLATHPGQLVDQREGAHWLNRDRLDEIWNTFSRQEGLKEADKREIEELCRQGRITCVNPCWNTTSGSSATGLEALGLEASGLEALGLEASGLEASGLEASGLGASGLEALGLEASGLGASGLEASGSGASGLEASGHLLSKPLRLNLLALGDVGSTVLMGLKLLAGERIREIGIWDMNPNQMKRWEFEMNQTAWAWEYNRLPTVRMIQREELFDCDVLVFCASKGVPSVEPVAAPGSERAVAPGSGKAVALESERATALGDRKSAALGDGKATAPTDVRMAQYEANRELVRSFGREARRAGFAGLFAVVSDPVDPLCRALFYASNQDENGKFDQAGLKPEQIQGYGLGVMNARAAYFAQKHSRFASFLEEGRAFGPHGQDLVIANSIAQYDDSLSQELTRLAAEANLAMREIGFKPYVAPALSSAVIPLIQTVSGQWHYSSHFLGGVFMGSKNRLTDGGLETETLSLPSQLEKRIQTAYDRLKAIEP